METGEAGSGPGRAVVAGPSVSVTRDQHGLLAAVPLAARRTGGRHGLITEFHPSDGTEGPMAAMELAPSVFRFARRRRGQTKQATATVGADLSAFAAWESGEYSLGPEPLQRIAATFGFPRPFSSGMTSQR